MPGLLLVPLAMVAFASAGQARPSAPSTAADDVRELGKSIEHIHPDPFRSVSRQRFESEVSALARQAPALSQDELLVDVMRIVALLGPRNGHTGLFPGDPSHTRELHLYPLRLYAFTDGVYVVDATDATLVRSRLVAIEGMPIETVLTRVEPLVPRDNPSNLRGLAPHFLLSAEVLDGLGIADDTGPAVFTLERPDRQRVDVPLTALPTPTRALMPWDALALAALCNSAQDPTRGLSPRCVLDREHGGNVHQADDGFTWPVQAPSTGDGA